MVENKLFKAWINPLAFQEIDEPWATPLKRDVSYENILNYICTPGTGSSISDLIGRYKEISVEPVRLFAAPVEDRILTKIVWPLRHAKACHMTGNYLGAISLCGMVAEMLAILIFEMGEIKINGNDLTLELQRSLFGSDFEKLNQERRVQVLRTYNLIPDEMKSWFDIVRKKRRDYLHIYSRDHDNLPTDAVDVFKATVMIVVKTIGQDIHDGKIILNPALIKYLEKHGALELYDESRGIVPGATP